jgi:aspartate kinase
MTSNKRELLIMKFGGTSVGSAEAMNTVFEIVQQEKLEWKNIAVVISAVSGATNILLETATKAANGNEQVIVSSVEFLKQKHFEIIERSIPDETLQGAVKEAISELINEFRSLCHAMFVLGETTPRALDAVASLGERMSVRVLSAIFVSKGIPSTYVDATELVVTNNLYQNANPDFAATTTKTRAVLNPLFAQNMVPIVTGFIGATVDGITTTLGRGGSDYSAAILGAVLPADDVWIWTDVDGVMTADPRIVPTARTIPEILYSEIAELAYYGAKVLHPKTVRPVIESGIGLRICNTFNPSHPGTRLVASFQGGEPTQMERIIKAVTTIRKQKLVTVEGRGMLGVPGVAARTFAAVASTGTSVPLITQSSSEQSICFAIPTAPSNDVITALRTEFSKELANNDIDGIFASNEVSILTVVGHGTKNTPGIAGLIFSKLGDMKINVLAIAHGSSDVSISLVIDSSDDEKAVICLHDLIK